AALRLAVQPIHGGFALLAHATPPSQPAAASPKAADRRLRERFDTRRAAFIKRLLALTPGTNLLTARPGGATHRRMPDARPAPRDNPSPDCVGIEGVQAAFEKHHDQVASLARLQHRRLYGDVLDDAVAETVGWAWKLFRKTALDGGDAVALLP